ncbi:uncharacterized protein K460DRAFT_368721 [Cucurbitaria berberidis CBS 394.84]|uniref:Uncharacterized protein n=1 Tax=Cucurbitaria berberidis CBS 394.84 TaxID=1168544 RepID=A0A9P4L783_9PLEO|nr:uncharacterized protein K460DRAFT_368721 [Cucurbitaria berberidis CBS 394.84]KAF1843863.1 hypothetical protein K460DRAFT_368721 [Cucurbitaria berberidis CBS 394.84]
MVKDYQFEAMNLSDNDQARQMFRVFHRSPLVEKFVSSAGLGDTKFVGAWTRAFIHFESTKPEDASRRVIHHSSMCEVRYLRSYVISCQLRLSGVFRKRKKEDSESRAGNTLLTTQHRNDRMYCMSEVHVPGIASEQPAHLWSYVLAVSDDTDQS